jgi:hypothetical protein
MAWLPIKELIAGGDVGSRCSSGGARASGGETRIRMLGSAAPSPMERSYGASASSFRTFTSQGINNLCCKGTQALASHGRRCAPHVRRALNRGRPRRAPASRPGMRCVSLVLASGSQSEQRMLAGEGRSPACCGDRRPGIAPRRAELWYQHATLSTANT